MILKTIMSFVRGLNIFCDDDRNKKHILHQTYGGSIDTLNVRVSNKLYPLLFTKLLNLKVHYTIYFKPASRTFIIYMDHKISKKPQFISTLNEYIQHELYIIQFLDTDLFDFFALQI